MFSLKVLHPKQPPTNTPLSEKPTTIAQQPQAQQDHETQQHGMYSECLHNNFKPNGSL